MSYRSSGSTFVGSLTSDESSSYIGPLPIVSFIEDIDAYAGTIFDMATKTMHDLQKFEQVKKDRAELVDGGKLDEQENLLAGFLGHIEGVQEKLSEMKQADFPALSLVWNSNDGRCCPDLISALRELTYSLEILGHSLQDLIKLLSSVERQVVNLRDNFDGQGSSRPARAHSEAAEVLIARHGSIMSTESNERYMRRRPDVHPCRGGLQLIRGDDRGQIERCLKKDLTPTQLDRLARGGLRGTYLFWKCEKCHFRLKYFVSTSQAASLLTNDDEITFRNSNIRCSRAFLAMSHLEQYESNRLSSSLGPAKFTCLICALHHPAAMFDRNRTFFTSEDYAKHFEDTHLHGRTPPAFILQKLRIECGERLSGGRRPELWIAGRLGR